MAVWVKQWNLPSEGEHNITLWAKEQDALRSTCDEIEDSITNNWDMDDEDQSFFAEEIQSLIQSKHYRSAINKWNEYQDSYNSDYAEYWHVFIKEVLTGDSGEVVTSAPPMAYKASSPGATCRGPCGQFNDYAYADKSDGTHLCRQCSTFQHIFGVKQ